MAEECSRIGLSCILAAGSGLLVLLAVAESTVYPFVPAAVSLVSLSIGIHYIRNKLIKIIIFIFYLISWINTIIYSINNYMILIFMAIGFAFLATVLTLLHGNPGAGLAVFGASYTALIVSTGPGTAEEAILSSGYILLGGLVASLLSGKPHPLFSIIAVPLPLALSGEAAMMLSLLAYMILLAGSGAVRWIGCPFRVDSGLVFYGFIVGLIGILSYNLVENDIVSLGLYSAGLLLLLAGILTPSSAPDSSVA